ncbi:CAP domain [Trinorchestia longiramus]|nr:CAP domain [Trinorchestia longiramus]
MARKLSLFASKSVPKMGKTIVTTETRTFKKGTRWYKETKVITVVEHRTGKNTSTKTTTEELPGPPRDSGSSSASSRSPSPERAAKKASASSSLPWKLKGKLKASSSSSDEEDKEEKLSKLALRKTNEKRKLHGVKALELSEKLNDEAKKWAKHLALQDKMEHKNDPNFGENIYKLSSNVPISWERRIQADPISHWYEEVKLHKFGQEPSGGKLNSGHFTQLVWKDVKEFGFGTAASASGLNVYFVAFFSPKGNWMGEFTEQVPPVGGFSDSLLNKVAVKLQKAAVGDGSSSSSSDEEEDFTEAVLKAHNDYRLKHGVTPLKISKKLNKTAGDWAKTIAKRDRLEHRPNNDYGENIYSKWNSRPNHSIGGKEPVDSWYSEIKNHVFGKEPTSLATGHFTQVVWADSKELGVGMARNKSSGKLYVVCNYNPPGNMVGSFAKKVPRAKR